MTSINVIGSNPGNDQASKWNMASAAMDPLKGDSEEKTGWSEDKGAGPMRAAPTQVLSTDAQLLGVTHEYTNTTPLAFRTLNADGGHIHYNRARHFPRGGLNVGLG